MAFDSGIFGSDSSEGEEGEKEGGQVVVAAAAAGHAIPTSPARAIDCRAIDCSPTIGGTAGVYGLGASGAIGAGGLQWSGPTLARDNEEDEAARMVRMTAAAWERASAVDPTAASSPPPVAATGSPKLFVLGPARQSAHKRFLEQRREKPREYLHQLHANRQTELAARRRGSRQAVRPFHRAPSVAVEDPPVSHSRPPCCLR